MSSVEKIREFLMELTEVAQDPHSRHLFSDELFEAFFKILKDPEQ